MTAADGLAREVKRLQRINRELVADLAIAEMRVRELTTVLRDLLDWEGYMGGWEGEAWQHAKQLRDQIVDDDLLRLGER